ncbi:hypothetical protein [Litorisediminicola beolgyonensis]|uniref:Uncharacterized protein n=1 Tax=Litorisediminicola beolgyonensis TaxID=1173614 RepID=A0ABW3ZK91_9RHOB
MVGRLFALGCALILGACASSSVVPVSKTEFMLQASAAPACGASKTAEFAASMAAIETLRSGYDGFVILGGEAQNNVRVIQRAPTYATTTSTYNVYGSSVYGESRTTYGGGGPVISGSHDQSLFVRMFRRGDAGFAGAVDARAMLGADWRELVENGRATCT